MKTAIRLFRLMRPFVWLAVLSVLLGAATTLAGVGLFGASAYLIAYAALHPSIAVLQVAIVSVRLFGILRAVFRYLERLVSHSVNFHLLARLRVAYFRALEPLTPARLSGTHSGELLAAAISDVNTLENFYVRAAAPPLSAMLVAVGVTFFTARFDPTMALFLSCGLFISGLILPVWAYNNNRRNGEMLIKTRTELQQRLVDGLQSMGELQVYACEEAYFDQLSSLEAILNRAQRRMGWGTAITAAGNIMLPALTAWAMLISGTLAVRAGDYSGIILAVLILVALGSFEAFTPLSAAAVQLRSTLEAGSRLFERMDQTSAVEEPAQPVHPTGYDLEMTGVSFAYRDDTEPALVDLNFSLPQGRKIAILGSSGAGKSTIFNLLLRFWDPDHGVICLGGYDLRNISTETLRGYFGWMSPSGYVFSGSVRTNLRMAGATASDEQMITALQTAGLGDWLANLPNGLDTWIGEHGLTISGGERTRLMLAQLLLHDAPIWLLDEPTASLDGQMANRLVEWLTHHAGERSLIWITHDLRGLQAMDEILVLKHGRVVERGAWQDLIRQNGEFRRMLELQNSMIEDPTGTISSPQASAI